MDTSNTNSEIVVKISDAYESKSETNRNWVQQQADEIAGALQRAYSSAMRNNWVGAPVDEENLPQVSVVQVEADDNGYSVWIEIHLSIDWDNLKERANLSLSEVNELMFQLSKGIKNELQQVLPNNDRGVLLRIIDTSSGRDQITKIT